MLPFFRMIRILRTSRARIKVDLATEWSPIVPSSPLDQTIAAPTGDDAARALESSRLLVNKRSADSYISFDGDDSRARLPGPAFHALVETLSQMARGNAVAITPIAAELTTQQAADLLGISRPHLVKLLDRGDLPHRKIGTHRRVTAADLLTYRQQAAARQREEQHMRFDTIESAIRAIAEGEMVIVVDDDDRENEGDLVMAANKATQQHIAFMIRHTSGIICVPLTGEPAQALRLDPMARENNAPLRTAFTVSVDYREGLTTGIAAEERANTVRALANGNTIADDFVRPGHVFPIVARDGGVLVRSGHTEAATDLARLAGFAPVGVIGELMNDDGTVRRLPALLAFAAEHHLKIVSIADLIGYRRRREQLVRRVRESTVATEIGPAHAITYATSFDQVQHLALVFGDITDALALPVRIHREEVIWDVFGRHPDGGNRLAKSLARIKRAGRGVVVYLRDGQGGLEAPNPAEMSETTSDQRRTAHWREIGVGAQILRDLGVSSIRLMTTHHFDYVGLSGFDIRITETDIIDG
jgi:3,4-dihydroxy 2-butanone 4-phosphate synthase / GTP cyclohydrolase II